MPLDKKNDPEDVEHHEAKGASSDESHELNSSGEGEVFRKRQRLRSPSPGLSPRGTPQASPPKFPSIDEIMAAASGVGNMVLAHEIAVDNNFTLKATELPEASLEKQIKDIVHKAFWDNLQAGLSEDPPNYEYAVNLLGEVKQELTSLLLPAHTKLRTEINERLDLELIKQQAEHDSIDVFKHANFVISIMAKLCAPARDDEIKKLTEIKDVVELFKEIFRIIELMKLDMANFTIQSMRPHIQHHSIEYERKKFEEFLKTQDDVDGLQFTKQWLKTAWDSVGTLQEAFKARSPSSSETVSDGASASAPPPNMPASVVLNQGYLNLLQWDDSQLFPETLLMDQSRFLDIRDKANRLVLVSSILLITYSIVGSAISGIQGFVDKLKNVINVLLEGESETDEVMTSLAEQICKEVNECLTKHDFPAMPESKENSLKKQIQDMKDPQHTVRKLLDSRSKEFFRFVISATAPFDPKKKIPAGLAPMHQELIDLSGQFLRLLVHNRAVFAPFYTDIIKEVREQTEARDEAEPTKEMSESKE